MGGFDSFLASLREKVEIKALIHPNGHKKMWHSCLFEANHATNLQAPLHIHLMSLSSSEIRF